MFSSTIIATFFLGLSYIPNSIAQPVNASDFIIKHTASDYFPNAKSDLSPFDVHVQFVGYNATTQSWLTGLNPASGSNDEEKAKLITAAAYAKPFDANDPDMTEDVNALLATINGNGNAKIIQKRADTFILSGNHAVNWDKCQASYSCTSGATCPFNLYIGGAPRSQCSSQGSENCCISWSTYAVKSAFFSTTYNSCNDQVQSSGVTETSCKGYGSSDQNGNVCFSNRATGCS